MKRLLFIILLLYTAKDVTAEVSAAGPCVGRFVNPVTDICWKCVFPIRIAGMKIVSGNPDTKSPKKPICFCKDPFPRVGIPVSFWEPARLVDVTRTPYCLVNMGGVHVAGTSCPVPA